MFTKLQSRRGAVRHHGIWSVVRRWSEVPQSGNSSEGGAVSKNDEGTKKTSTQCSGSSLGYINLNSDTAGVVPSAFTKTDRISHFNLQSNLSHVNLPNFAGPRCSPRRGLWPKGAMQDRNFTEEISRIFSTCSDPKPERKRLVDVPLTKQRTKSLGMLIWHTSRSPLFLSRAHAAGLFESTSIQQSYSGAQSTTATTTDSNLLYAYALDFYFLHGFDFYLGQRARLLSRGGVRHMNASKVRGAVDCKPPDLTFDQFKVFSSVSDTTMNRLLLNNSVLDSLCGEVLIQFSSYSAIHIETAAE